MSSRVAVVAAALAVLAGGLSACVSATEDPAPTLTERSTQTITNPAPPPDSSGPVSGKPTTTANATSCPLLEQQQAADRVGMRLERITVLKSAGKTVGCRFFALQNSPLHDSEHLPGPNQPAIEISSARYPDAVAAHNAFIRIAQAGASLQQAEIASDNTGLCYQTEFYPKDKGKDWACTFSIGPTVVVVKTVVTNPAFNAVQLAKAVAPKFA